MPSRAPGTDPIRRRDASLRRLRTFNRLVIVAAVVLVVAFSTLAADATRSHRPASSATAGVATIAPAAVKVPHRKHRHIRRDHRVAPASPSTEAAAPAPPVVTPAPAPAPVVQAPAPVVQAPAPVPVAPVVVSGGS